MIKRTIYYIHEIMEMRKDIKTDAALARELGITRQAISQYRAGQSMNVYVAVKLARLLGLNPMETISATMYEQAKTEEEKKFWLAEFYSHENKEPRTVSVCADAPPDKATAPHPRRRGRFG
jgi:predicted transcriptional regulator